MRSDQIGSMHMPVPPLLRASGEKTVEIEDVWHAESAQLEEIIVMFQHSKNFIQQLC